MKKLAVMPMYTQSTFKVRIHTRFYHVGSHSLSSICTLLCRGIPRYMLSELQNVMEGRRCRPASTQREDVEGFRSCGWAVKLDEQSRRNVRGEPVLFVDDNPLLTGSLRAFETNTCRRKPNTAAPRTS